MKFPSKYLFPLLICLSLGLSWYFHRDAGRFDPRAEIWSDRAGYYIYLPATFFYYWDTRRMPPDLDVKTGGGFSLDTTRNRIETRYTYGVALMISPFFLTAHLGSSLTGAGDEGGFSTLYHRATGLAAVFYLVMGLWLLWKFLIRTFRPAVAFTVILLLFVGTNLFYYSLVDGLMSHVYSFFLFSLFLFSMQKERETGKYGWCLLTNFSIALAVLIRPTAILLVAVYLLWDAGSRKAIAERLKQFLSPSRGGVLLAFLFILFLPQMFYWKHLSGHWLFFSYKDEGFTRLADPKIPEVLFSPVNGLFLYTPLALFFVAGIVMMILRKAQNGWLMAGLFALITWIFASWKMWYFGCSFGQRSYIEYFALFAVPLGFFATGLFRAKPVIPAALLFFLLFFTVYYNLRLTCSLYRFDKCYFGSTWDWDHYARTLERAGIISPIRQTKTFTNDFENMAILPVKKPSPLFTRSGQYSVAANTKGVETTLWSAALSGFGNPVPKTIGAEVWILKPGRASTGASLYYTLSKDTTILFSDSICLDSLVRESLSWVRVSKTFIVPDIYDSAMQLRIFIRNPKKKMLCADDLALRFRYGWNER